MPLPLDNDAEQYLRLRRQQSVLVGGADTLDPVALRDEERALRARYGHGPQMHRETLVKAHGGIPRHFILDPAEAPLGELIHFHGGGWVMGEPEDYLAVCRALAKASGWRVVVPDYRKAPEHPFPAGLDDCRAIVGERLRVRDAGGPDGSLPLAVGGDSAGGNLAAVITAERAATDRDALAAQVLITPVLDSDLDRPSYRDPGRQLTLTRDAMAWFWDQYHPRGPRVDPALAPLRSPHLAALPTTVFISVGTDVLRSEGEAYLALLADAGVDVRHREFAGQLHGFFQLHNVMAASTQAVDTIAEELRAIARASQRTNPTHTGGLS
ncbi:alpha/beta hydrolase [Microbacterium sp.]|uniref:alpha/beta hydrolase n=1 Tax=Microbacterium sp. TaxID=51671 RepID=UPI0037C5CB55